MKSLLVNVPFTYAIYLGVALGPCPPPQCDNCGDGKECQVNGRSAVHCGTAVCVDKPSGPVACAGCILAEGPCDVCEKGQVCVQELFGDCKKCPELKCVTPQVIWVDKKINKSYRFKTYFI